MNPILKHLSDQAQAYLQEHAESCGETGAVEFRSRAHGEHHAFLEERRKSVSSSTSMSADSQHPNHGKVFIFQEEPEALRGRDPFRVTRFRHRESRAEFSVLHRHPISLSRLAWELFSIPGFNNHTLFQVLELRQVSIEEWNCHYNRASEAKPW